VQRLVAYEGRAQASGQHSFAFATQETPFRTPKYPTIHCIPE